MYKKFLKDHSEKLITSLLRHSPAINIFAGISIIEKEHTPWNVTTMEPAMILSKSQWQGFSLLQMDLAIPIYI